MGAVLGMMGRLILMITGGSRRAPLQAILIVFGLSLASIVIPHWQIPGTEFERGDPDTPLGLKLGLDLQGGVHLVYETVDPNPSVEALEGTIAVIRNRVDAFGVAEPLIQTLGDNRVVVQLPGVSDVAAAKELIGAPAELDFRERIISSVESTPGAEDDGTETPAGQDTSVPDEGTGTPVASPEADVNASTPGTGSTPAGGGGVQPQPVVTPEATPTGQGNDATLQSTNDPAGTPQPASTPDPAATPEPPEFQAEFVIASAEVNGREIVLTGNQLVPGAAQVSFDPTTGSPEVILQFKRDGARAFEIVSGRNIGRQLGIFLDGVAVSTPVIQTEIQASQNPRITGLSLEEAQILAIQLNAGAFPTPLNRDPILERDVDAFLGATALDKGLRAGLIGLGLVVLFMILFYRMNGVVAAAALTVYATVVLAIFKFIPVILTLSGLAAFVLSIGIAVDANVLIFERMKEELRAGRSLGSAIEIGFNRAWTAIRDGNFTTLITAAILFWFGERLGANIVQGFALTLAIGVGISLFSALFVTRRFLNIAARSPVGRRLNWFIP
ncbi:MAG: protein translocase subunit SecD [Dehalococcoidia bacterium]|nr:protein translocase subunit SecD [Dehalococcoidia bacterium]